MLQRSDSSGLREALSLDDHCDCYPSLSAASVFTATGAPSLAPGGSKCRGRNNAFAISVGTMALPMTSKESHRDNQLGFCRASELRRAKVSRGFKALRGRLNSPNASFASFAGA
jgi:hypothetical protein